MTGVQTCALPIYYQKAYDLVHSWILEALRMVGVAEGIRKLLENSKIGRASCRERV